MATDVLSAPITWSTAVNITADTDVITGGTLVYAFNFVDTTTNVNGVTFASFYPIGGTNLAPSTQVNGGGSDYFFTTGSTPFAALSPAYRLILTGGLFLQFQSPPPQVSFVLSNLTVGHAYTVQFWVNDPRGPYNSRTETINGGGNVVLLKFSQNYGNSNPGGPGQFSVGTFTANASFQSFTLTGDATNQVIQMNAIQVRDTSVSGLPVLDFINAAGPATMQVIFHGPQGNQYTLLTTTNLTTPIAKWLTNGTGTFAAGSMTNVDSAATNRSQFYRLRSP